MNSIPRFHTSPAAQNETQRGSLGTLSRENRDADDRSLDAGTRQFPSSTERERLQDVGRCAALSRFTTASAIRPSEAVRFAGRSRSSWCVARKAWGSPACQKKQHKFGLEECKFSRIRGLHADRRVRPRNRLADGTPKSGFHRDPVRGSGPVAVSPVDDCGRRHRAWWNGGGYFCRCERNEFAEIASDDGIRARR